MQMMNRVVPKNLFYSTIKMKFIPNEAAKSNDLIPNREMNGITLFLASFVEIAPTFVALNQLKIAPLLIKNHHYDDGKGIDSKYIISSSFEKQQNNLMQTFR